MNELSTQYITYSLLQSHRTALMLASDNGDSEIVSILLARAASILIRGEVRIHECHTIASHCLQNGNTVLEYAREKERRPCILLLEKVGC